MFVRVVITLLLTLLLPLAGVALSGGVLEDFYAFPPAGQRRDYPGFAWPAFVGIWLVFALLVVGWILGVRRAPGPPPPQSAVGRFPAWGWLGIALVAAFWFFAWVPVGVEPLRRYAFPPLWLGFVITVNACLCRRTGRCPLTHETGLLLTLFPASVAFWWLFEYLNRFVDNWVYVHAGEPGATEYILHASFSFSVVLPAVYSVRSLLGSYETLQWRLASGPRLGTPAPKWIGCALLLLFGLGLAGIGAAPAYLFPLLWVGPLGIWIGLELLTREQHPWREIESGDWRNILGWALAALICGFFWELWNVASMPKWEYQIPWFERFYLFEMPVSGYLGYLPFGLECAVAVMLLRRWIRPSTD